MATTHRRQVAPASNAGGPDCPALPVADHTKSGTAYLPADQLAAWGHGLALLARDLLS